MYHVHDIYIYIYMYTYNHMYIVAHRRRGLQHEAERLAHLLPVC